MSTDTMSERYIDEVVRRLPDDQRSDVAEELRATIADAVEAHPEPDTVTAEHDVLTQMGDPVRLAANYADRPLTLIGPTLYPSYIHMLKLLLLGVLPVVVALLVAVDIVENTDPGSAIATGIGTILTVGGQMVAWLTAVYAFVDRATGAADKNRIFASWTPDKLPDRAKEPSDGICGPIISMLFSGLIVGLIVWQRTGNAEYVEGERVQVLDPALWSGWIWPVVVGLGAMVVLELGRIAVGRWTKPLAITHATVETTVAATLVLILVNQQFFNPEFLLIFNEELTVTDEFYTIAILFIIGIAAWSIIDTLRAAYKRSSR